MWRPRSRRSFLAGGGALALAAPLLARRFGRRTPPVRAITRGPKHHWFGYYDKLQFDPSGRFALGMEVDFEGRTPRAGDVIGIGVIDLEDEDRWTPIGTSRAWGWQQGCMLQWIPGSRRRILWNDREDGRFVCRVHDLDRGTTRTLPRAVYTLSSDGRSAVSVDFARLQDCRPGYGYVGLEDPRREEAAPEETGVFRLDLESGSSSLLLTLDRIARFDREKPVESAERHWINHLLFRPDGRRFIFLHRWRPRPGEGWWTRMFTARDDGADLHVLDPSGHTSHFIWRDDEHVLAWTRPRGEEAGFYLLRDRSREVRPIGEGVMTRNGHCTYLPGTEGAWILNDTYPDRERLQTVYLFHVPTGRIETLGRFHSPEAYRGEWRCDTHPRSSPDGRSVVIDSPHGGEGRQMYLIDVAEVVDR